MVSSDLRRKQQIRLLKDNNSCLLYTSPGVWPVQRRAGQLCPAQLLYHYLGRQLHLQRSGHHGFRGHGAGPVSYTHLLFLGILLGIIFLLATALIIYYKQVSEGYEDQGRFEIMRKVGLEERQVRSSIRSQVLTVFFLPILAAAIHILFDFNMVVQLLSLFAIRGVTVAALCTAGTVLAVSYTHLDVYKRQPWDASTRKIITWISRKPCWSGLPVCGDAMGPSSSIMMRSCLPAITVPPGAGKTALI